MLRRRVRRDAVTGRDERSEVAAGPGPAAHVLQRIAGNAAVGALAGAARAASAGEIARAAAAGPSAALRLLGLPVAQLDWEAIVTNALAGSSTAAAPPKGAEQIRAISGSGSTAGVTELPAPAAPDLVVHAPQRADGGYVATVAPTSTSWSAPTSLYPAPGVHDHGTNAGGQASHLLVSPAMSALIRDGEQEHLRDLRWAHALAYERAAAAVNGAATAPPAPAPTPEAAAARARDEVRRRLPPQLRWGSGVEPITAWRVAYGRLVGATIDRDRNGWHSIDRAFVLEPRRKRAAGVPVADELIEYTGGTEIGVHPPADLMRERFEQLPATP